MRNTDPSCKVHLDCRHSESINATTHSVLWFIMKRAGSSSKQSKRSSTKARKRSSSAESSTSKSGSGAHSTSLPVNARTIQLVKVPHTVVNHSYVDYSRVVPDPEDNERPSKIADMGFHDKLHHILARSEFVEFIRWLPHGRAFRVEVPSKFEKTVCPEYFDHKRYSSFLYQVGVHGYKQISAGKDRGAYYSPVCFMSSFLSFLHSFES